MSLFKKLYSLARNIALGLIFAMLFNHCSSRKAVDAEVQPPATKTIPRSEGGIVGTGNTQECKDKKDKSQCSEAVQ